MATKEIAAATGRRKTSVARVQLLPGSGKFRINKQEFADYFSSEALCNYILQPMTLTSSQEKYDVVASARGGGISGQAGAVRHAMSRALIMADDSLRPPLKSSGCLTRDARMKERKKPGQPGARKRFQFSKR